MVATQDMQVKDLPILLPLTQASLIHLKRNIVLTFLVALPLYSQGKFALPVGAPVSYHNVMLTRTIQCRKETTCGSVRKSARPHCC